MPGEDRLTALLEQPVKRVTAIDFIQVVDPADQTILRVYFLIDPDKLINPIINTGDLPVDVSTDTVTIVSISGGERLAEAACGARDLQAGAAGWGNTDGSRGADG
ncbi:MAG: hypothetical protein M3255_02405 [Pseudomonadota bacterium]|nr:hypothetical protein [Pseudomonadota bacterium]